MLVVRASRCFGGGLLEGASRFDASMATGLRFAMSCAAAGFEVAYCVRLFRVGLVRFAMLLSVVCTLLVLQFRGDCGLTTLVVLREEKTFDVCRLCF